MAREWRFVLATFAASGVGYLGSGAAPVIVQALLDSGMSHQRAGDLGAIELLTLALASLAVAPFVARTSHRRLALGGAATAALGLAVSALAEGYLPMALGRVVIGVGSALAIAGANAAVSAREDADRIFAIIWTLGGGVTGLLAIQLPTLVVGGNYAVGFGALLLLCVAAMPLIAWVPPRPPRFSEESAVLSVVAGAEALGALGSVREQISTGRAARFGPEAWLVLAGIFAYSVAEMALWQFAYDIPVDHGVAYDSVRYVLGITTFAGLLGGAIAARLGVRWRRAAPLVVGCLVSLMGRWVYIEATSTGMLVVGSMLWGLGFYFVSPYQIGLAAALDRRGRVAVVATAMFNLGYAVGPILGGRIRQLQLERGLDSSVLVLVIGGATLVSLLLLLPPALRLDRAMRASRTRP